MGLFFYNQKGSIISIEDLPTTEIIEPKLLAMYQKSPPKVCTDPKKLDN